MTGLDIKGFTHLNGNGQTTFGLQIAPKALTIIYSAELGKLVMFLAKGIEPVKARNDIAGMGMDRKRMASWNEAYKGSNFALTRKGADLS